ncbi:MAG: plasmid stabilization system protein ParE [Gammaproteobacteria bacterium]|jgi:plasmid stabilization system protein ParE
MVLEWNFPALDDLGHLRDHIAGDSARSARRSIQRIFNATEPLPEHRHNVRELPFEHYQIIYRVQPWDAG